MIRRRMGMCLRKGTGSPPEWQLPFRTGAFTVVRTSARVTRQCAANPHGPVVLTRGFGDRSYESS
jgi:hypothetical protein